MAQHPGGTVENASRSAEELSITNEGLHFTVGNCENAKTHGARGGANCRFLPLVIAKTPRPTVHGAAQIAVCYRW